MKIELDLSRAEAHELNYLIVQGHRLSKPSRLAARAASTWHEAYLEGMKNG